ncbi:hypothetical protein [Rhizobium grahamii]|nr:hypothetical protein [Rhizobium grahamii]
MKVRPIGVRKMVDNDEVDDKSSLRTSSFRTSARSWN